MDYARTASCLAVFPYAERVGRGWDFIEHAGRGIWSQAVDVGTEAGLRRVVEAAGLDWGEAVQSTQDPGWKEASEANRETLFELGLWGVPSFRMADGYATWGQDRLWVLERRIRAALAARENAS